MPQTQTRRRFLTGFHSPAPPAFSRAVLAGRQGPSKPPPSVSLRSPTCALLLNSSPRNCSEQRFYRIQYVDVAPAFLGRRSHCALGRFSAWPIRRQFAAAMRCRWTDHPLAGSWSDASEVFANEASAASPI